MGRQRHGGPSCSLLLGWYLRSPCQPEPGHHYQCPQDNHAGSHPSHHPCTRGHSKSSLRPRQPCTRGNSNSSLRPRQFCPYTRGNSNPRRRPRQSRPFNIIYHIAHHHLHLPDCDRRRHLLHRRLVRLPHPIVLDHLHPQHCRHGPSSVHHEREFRHRRKRRS